MVVLNPYKGCVFIKSSCRKRYGRRNVSNSIMRQELDFVSFEKEVRAWLIL